MRERCEVRQASGIGEFQRRHRELVLGSHMQHLAARHQYLEPRAGGEQVYYLYGCAHHLLKVVQQEQHLLLSQVLPQAFQQGLAHPFPHAEGLGDGGHNQFRVADGSQVHEEYAVGEGVAQFRCQLQAQAGLACAAGTCQGRQAHILLEQELLDGGQFLLPSNEGCELDRQVIGKSVQGTEGREVGRQVRDDQLEEAPGASQVLEAVFSQVPQAHIIRQVLLYEVAGCLGEQYLSAMCGAHDAGRALYVQANVALGCQRWFTSVQTHAHTHRHAFRPGMGSEGALRLYDCQHRVSGACESDKEGIILLVDLVAIPLLEGSTQQAQVLRQHGGVAVTQLLEQVRRPFDIGEEQGDRSRWQAARRGLTLPARGCVFRGRGKERSSRRFRVEGLFQGPGKVWRMRKTQLGVLGQGLQYDMLKRS